MDSMLGNLPSINPQNFSQLRPSDPSNSSSIPLSTESEELEVGIESTEAIGAFMPRKPSTVGSHFKKTPVTYRPTHDRTIPPPDQVINSDEKNILLRQFYQRAEEKLRPKRAASENLSPEHANKHPRASSLDSSL